MHTDSISFNNKIFAAKTGAKYKKEKTENLSAKTVNDVLKPLEYDTLTFLGKKKNTKKENAKMPSFVCSFLLSRGQKRAQKLEAQAEEIKKDAAEALGYSYVDKDLLKSNQVLIDGVETQDDVKSVAQQYTYKGGVLTVAEFNIQNSLETGIISTKQRFEFKDGKLSAVYENITKFPNGTTDYYRKYEADKKGRLVCVYNKVL